jgi:hypothetical protein
VFLALGAASAPATIGNSNPVVPRSEAIGGHTYADWAARYWQWDLANVRWYQSGAPKVPQCTTQGQHGPVWFLHGDNYSGAGNAITRVCAVPANRYLFLYGSGDCSTVERPPFHATTNPGLVRCARSAGSTSGTFTLDGRRLSPSGFAVATKAFRFVVPPRNNQLLVPGATHGRAAAYGLAVVLKPLDRGPHVLVQVQRLAHGLVLRSTYRLTIG